MREPASANGRLLRPRLLSWLLALGVAIAATAIAAPSARAQSPDKPAAVAAAPQQGKVKVVAFGSSSTEGIGASAPMRAYPAQLERLLNAPSQPAPEVAVVNRGVGGEDIDDMLKRINADVLSRKPDLVIWQVGSNDPLRGVPLDRFETKLRAGIAEFRKAGVEVFLMEPQWCPQIDAADAGGAFLRMVRKVGADEKVSVVRRYDLMRAWLAKGLVDRDKLVGPDGLHMTDRGYELLARAVSEQIRAESSVFRRKKSVATAASNL